MSLDGWSFFGAQTKEAFQLEIGLASVAELVSVLGVVPSAAADLLRSRYYLLLENSLLERHVLHFISIRKHSRYSKAQPF